MRKYFLLLMIIPLFIIFLAGVVYRFYFMDQILSTERIIRNQLETLVLTKGNDISVLNQINKEISDLPTVTPLEIKIVKNSLQHLKNSFTAKNFYLASQSIGKILHKVQNRLLNIFVGLLLMVSSFSLALTLLIYVSRNRSIFQEVNSLSEELSKIDFLHIPQIRSSRYFETQNLTNSFNSVLKHLQLYKFVFDASVNSTNLTEFSQQLFYGLKKWYAVDYFSIAEIVEGKISVNVNIKDSQKKWSYRTDKTDLQLRFDNLFIKVSDIPSYIEEHPHSFISVFDENLRSGIALHLDLGKESHGVLFLGSLKKGTFDGLAAEELKIVANAISFVYKKILTIQNLTMSIVSGFTELVEGKDEETKEHLLRMASYSRTIAQELSKSPKFFNVINPNFIEQIYKQAPLHDIGKVGVPDHILRKPGKLNSDEFEKMKIHTVVGYQILDHIESQIKEKFFGIGKNIARFHHERWDGKGYPDGLKGEEIPLCARIVAVADVFDALTTSRPYKKAINYEKSITIILKESGTHFDPDVVNAFIRAESKIRRLYREFNQR